MSGHRKAPNTIALLLTDAQRSVVRIADEKPWQSYLPFGHQTTEQPTSCGFNGELRDLLTGHYCLGNGYRVSNTNLGRFQSPDIFSPFGSGGINAYAYCEGDPINHTDPTGHARTKATELLKFKKLGIINNTIMRPIADPTPSLSRNRQKIIKDLNDFDSLLDSGALRGNYTEYPALTGDPKDSGQQVVPEDIFQKIKTVYEFGSNDTPSLLPYATTRGDGTSILDTYQFDSSRRYHQSKALDPSLPPAERKIFSQRANSIETMKRIYIKKHYRHTELSPAQPQSLVTTITNIRS